MTHYIHVTDPPVRFRSGDRVVGHRFVVGGSLYGRVLFTQVEAVELEAGAQHIVFERCHFQSMCGGPESPLPLFHGVRRLVSDLRRWWYGRLRHRLAWGRA